MAMMTDLERCQVQRLQVTCLSCLKYLQAVASGCCSCVADFICLATFLACLDVQLWMFGRLSAVCAAVTKQESADLQAEAISANCANVTQGPGSASH